MVREILNTQNRIEDWSEIQMKASVLLESRKCKDDLVEYLRYLAWKKIDYKVTQPQFQNARDLFKLITDSLNEKKDFVTLGYFVYYTQYFYYKQEGETTPQAEGEKPVEETVKVETDKPAEEQNEGEEKTEEKAGDEEDDHELADLLNDDEDDPVEEGEDQENDNKENQEKAQTPQSKSQTSETKNVETQYFMMADFYFTYDFAKNKEFWVTILSQIYNV